MKKTVIALVVFLTLSVPCLALADVDLTGLSYDELVALKDQINLAMWQSEEWQEVTVPQGVWQVGVDIPAGHWTIKAYDGANTSIKYGSRLDSTGRDMGYGDFDIYETVKSPSRSTFRKGDDQEQIDIDAKDGYYFVIDNGDAVFTPYTGKASLGFK